MSKKEEYAKIQTQLKTKLVLPNTFDLDTVKYIGGMDISFDKKDSKRASVVLVVYENVEEWDEKIEPVYQDGAIVTLTEEYIPGFLAFREVDHYMALIKKLQATKPELMPQVLMVDGNGILHCNEFGMACHLGVLLDMPVFGVSKTFFNVDGLDEKIMYARYTKTCKEKLDTLTIKGNSGKIWGAMMRTGDINGIYISAGHKIDLGSCIVLVKKMCLFKNPEPLRVADILGRKMI